MNQNFNQFSEQHLYFSVMDVIEAFKTHGVNRVLTEVLKDEECKLLFSKFVDEKILDAA